MPKLFLIFFLIFCSAKSFAARVSSVSVSVGSPQTEFSKKIVPQTFVLADSRNRSSGKHRFREFYNLKTFDTDHRLFRVHIPLKIISKRLDGSKVISILYSFNYKYELYRTTSEGKEHIIKSEVFPVKWEEIPLSDSGITEWTLTSEWMVKSDRKLWDPDKGGFAESSDGSFRMTKTARESDRSFISISDTYFPFKLSYWNASKGILEKFPEVIFPDLFFREVKGNEKFSGVNLEVFAGGLEESSSGNIDLSSLHSLVKNITNGWENPYLEKNSYSNNFLEKSWAIQYKKIAGEKLKAAFLARIFLTDPEDSDAADLLLKNLVAQKDSEKASRIYLQCKKNWPEFSEYWFKLYSQCIQDKLTHRAAVMAFRQEFPESGFALSQLVNSLIESERWNSAKTLQLLWAEKEPSNIFAYVAASKIAEANKDKEKVKNALCRIAWLINSFSEAEKPQPYKNTKAYELYLKAINLLNTEKYNQALSFLRKSIENNQDFVPAYIAMGEIYLNIKILGSAKRQFDEAFKFEPDNPDVLSGLIRSSKNNLIYQKKLWTVLSKEILIEKNKGNWTNALNIAKFALPLLTEKLYISSAISYAESLIKLKLYEDASVLLYKLSDQYPDNPKVNYLWGEFSQELSKNPNLLVLVDEPADWNKKAIDAFNAVLKHNSKSIKAYAQLAILHLEEGNTGKAYKNLIKCYRFSPSPDLALWIADICLLEAFKSSYAVIPSQPQKKYLDVSKEFYNKVSLIGKQRYKLKPSFFPAAGEGILKANRISKFKSSEPKPILRRYLELFPEFPGLIAEKIKLHTETETAAPIIWVPYTNMLTVLRPCHYEVLSVLGNLYNQRKLKKKEVETLINLAVTILKWDDIYFSEIFSKYEYQQPPEIYTLEKKRDFKFIIKNHLFLKPVPAYNWYALRSKYEKIDLMNGRTKWWNRHLLVKTALDILRKAVVTENKSNGKARQYFYLLERTLGNSLQLDETNVQKAYASILRDCFYMVTGKGSGRQQRLKRSSNNNDFKDSVEISSYEDLLKQVKTPLIIRDRWALPPKLREIYLPTFALQNIFHQDYKNRFSPVWNKLNLKSSTLKSINWPASSTNILFWHESSKRQIMNLNFFEKELKVEQAYSTSPTSFWKGAGGAIMTEGSTSPKFKSFLLNTISGSVQNIKIAGAKLDKKNPPEFSLIFSPSPMDCPVEEWYDEALVLQLSWPNHTNPVFKIFAKVYNKENGMVPGSPGIKLGEFSAIDFSDIYWELSKDKIKAGKKGSKNKKDFLKVNHKLSPFAWTHGFYINLQFKSCENPVSYSLEKITVNVENLF